MTLTLVISLLALAWLAVSVVVIAACRMAARADAGARVIGQRRA